MVDTVIVHCSYLELVSDFELGIIKPHSSFPSSIKLGMFRMCTKMGQAPQIYTDIAGRFLSNELVSGILVWGFLWKLVISYLSYSFLMLAVIHKTEWTRKRKDLDIYLEKIIGNYFPISPPCRPTTYITCAWKLQQACKKGISIHIWWKKNPMEGALSLIR